MLLVGAVGGSAFQAVAGDDGPQPVVEIADRVVDLGELEVGSKAAGVFSLRNTGDAPLVIRGVRPHCGCTVADYDRSIPPGETGQIKAVLDTTGFRGPLSRSIAVFTNDAVTPQLNLVLRAQVVSTIEILPRPLVRFNVLQGEPATDSVVLVSPDGAEFRVLGVAGTDDRVAAEFRELADGERIRGRQGSQWEVAVTVPAGAREGVLNQRLTVKTDFEKAPEVTVAVSGVVRPIIQVVPGELNFGSVRSGQSVSRNLVVVNNRLGHDLVVTGVVVDESLFAVDIATAGSSPRVQVTVTLKPDTPPGSYSEILRVNTNDPVRGAIEIPVRAVVQ